MAKKYRAAGGTETISYEPLSFPPMTYKDYIQQLEKQTSAISYEKGLAMVIQLCRKLLPDYQAFSATHGWGDPRVLEEALQCCE
jgi:hypothetical protein